MKILQYHTIAGRFRALLRHLPAVAVVGIALSCLCACHGKDHPIPDPTPEEEEDMVEYLSISLNTNHSALSRADEEGPTWGDPYTDEAGNLLENRISPKKIHVAIFDEDKNFIRLVSSADIDSKVTLYSVDQTTGLHHIVFNTTGLGIKRNKTYYSMVMVNFTLPADLSFSNVDVEKLTFALSDLTGNNPTEGTGYYSKGYVPMFGFAAWKVGDFTFPEERPGFPSVATVDLIRSVCKIEVLLPTEQESEIAPYLEFNDQIKPHLAYVSGKHLNKSGFVTPKKAIWLDDAINESKDLKFADSYSERVDRWVSADAANTNMYLPATITNDDGKIIGYYIYLPEASGQSMRPYDDALRLNVSVKYTPEGGETRVITGTLFPSIAYDKDTHAPADDVDYKRWKLYRNHIYRFTITGVSNETSLDYGVSVTGSQTIDVPDFV